MSFYEYEIILGRDEIDEIYEMIGFFNGIFTTQVDMFNHHGCINHINCLVILQMCLLSIQKVGS